MTEDELKAIENGPDAGAAPQNNPQPEVAQSVQPADTVSTETPTETVAETSETTTTAETTTPESENTNPEEETKPVVDEAKRQKQGERIGFVFLFLLIIGIIGAIVFAINKDKIFGLHQNLPQRGVQQETPEIEEVEPIEKKDLAEPPEDSGVIKDDVNNGTFAPNAYIGYEEDGAKWFKCKECKVLGTAKDIYINANNKILYIGEDGYLYNLVQIDNTYTPKLITEKKKLSKIFNENLFKGEDGIYYSYKIEEGETIFYKTDSKIPNTLSATIPLKKVYNFRPNINDYNFNLGIDERYYVYENDKVYLIDNEGKRSDLLFTLGNDENLVYVTGNVIKTTKMFYSIQSKEINGSYDYQFYPDNITKYYGQIKYYNTNLVIDSRNNVYLYGVKGEEEQYENN